MDEPPKLNILESPEIVESQERTKRVTHICYASGTVGFFAVLVLGLNATWPTAIAILGLAAMFVGIAFFVLKRN